MGAHKTSMLQDLEAGRPLELECMVGAVLELGALLEQPMPNTQAIYGLTKLLAAGGQRIPAPGPVVQPPVVAGEGAPLGAGALPRGLAAS